MQRNLVKRKVSAFIKPLTVGLLIVVMFLSLSIGGFLLWQQEKAHVRSKQEKQQSVRIPLAKLHEFYVSEDGTVFPIEQEESVPAIIAQTDTLYGGETIGGEAFTTTLRIISQLEQHGIAVVSVTIYNDTYMELLLPNAITTYYSTRTDPKLMASSLQTMQSVFTIEGKFPNEIDFRFTKPVIRY